MLAKIWLGTNAYNSLFLLLSAKHSNPHPNSLRYNSWDDGKSKTSPP
nr:MAG TPA: hypothetical protein [Caudoviricetes sp.]